MRVHDFAIETFPGHRLHETLKRFRDEGPVARIKFLGMPAWLLVSHAETASAFRDGDRFPPEGIYDVAIGAVVGDTFQTMSGQQHQRYRQLATPAFKASAIAGYDDQILTDLANELIDGFRDESGVDLVQGFTKRFPFIVISRLLGIPRDAEDDFFRWGLGMLSYAGDAENALQCAREFNAYMAPIVQQRRAQPRDDTLSTLIAGEVEGQRLTDEEILANIRLLFSAGAATTHDGIGSLIYALLTQRECWEHLRMEPEDIGKAVNETLRWESPVSTLPRLANSGRGIEVAGQSIEAGAFVLFGSAAANRDPRVFDDPDTFDMDRDCSSMLTFGPGPRMCPGIHLARKQMAISLRVLMERLPDLCLMNPDKAVPKGTIMRGPERLDVRFR